jgi:hypothetical protein
MKPEKYRIIKLNRRFYPQQLVDSWFSWLGAAPHWENFYFDDGYGSSIRDYDNEADARRWLADYIEYKKEEGKVTVIEEFTT